MASDGRIIGEGWHHRSGEPHAEVNAFRAVQPSDEPLLPTATIYVSLEPCSHYGKTPPCCDLIISKHIGRVVVGCQDPFDKVQGRGIKRLREAGISVTVGVLERECQWMNRRFFTYHAKHRPYIILKWAQTENRFIDDNGRQLPLSSPFTKMLVHKMRTEEDAILVGRVTDEREHPQLNVRHWHGTDPLRLVLSGSLHNMLDECYRQGVQSLIVEGGRATLQSFIDENLWDEARIETAPVSVGQGTPAPVLPESASPTKEETFDGRTIRYYTNQKEK